jgi:hypothetical protein
MLGDSIVRVPDASSLVIKFSAYCRSPKLDRATVELFEASNTSRVSRKSDFHRKSQPCGSPKLGRAEVIDCSTTFSQQSGAMASFLLGLFRLIWLFGKGHPAVVLENVALRQQLAIY